MSSTRKVYAECDIVMSPALSVKPLRKRMAEINVDIMSSQGVNPPKPIKLVIKGERFQRVMELMTLNSQPDDVLVKKVRGSLLAKEVKDLTDEEAAAWVRQNIIAELTEMGGADEDPLV